jgi:hemerythrin-like domain-containing protein
VAAQRLERGDSAYREMADVAASIVALWDRELADHFAVEEEIVFARSYSDRTTGMIARVLREHRHIRSLVEMCGNGNCGEATARELGKLLKEHIRFEERQLFPAIQEELTSETLQQIGAEIRLRMDARP